MTPEARQAMRDALRHALRTGDLPASGPEHPGPFVDMVPAISNLEARFTAELQALAGVVHHASNPDDIVAIVREMLMKEGATDVLAWDDRWLPVPGMSRALEAAGIRVLHQHPSEAQDHARRDVWARAGVGLTGAVACLAETGSIVVISGPGRGRLASLLPPVHVALVTRDLLVPSLPVLLASRPVLATSGTNMVCITGPSRTADIEHTLSRGVHGPREVHVVFVA